MPRVDSCRSQVGIRRAAGDALGHALGERRDGCDRISAQGGGNDRSVRHVEALVAEYLPHLSRLRAGQAFRRTVRQPAAAERMHSDVLAERPPPVGHGHAGLGAYLVAETLAGIEYGLVKRHVLLPRPLDLEIAGGVEPGDATGYLEIE